MNDLPDFIVEGEWHDEEWRRLSQKLLINFTGADLFRLMKGPREHPYGPGANMMLVDGKNVWFPPAEQQAA